MNPPPGTGDPGNPQAVQNAMATTLFHWTLHPWAIYAVVGLAIAYGVYRKGRLQLISAAFEPLIGRHAHGPWAKIIDMLAIFATPSARRPPWGWAPCRSAAAWRSSPA